jgi:hypothetical protein
VTTFEDLQALHPVCGADVGPGWHPLVTKLHDDLIALVGEYTLDQIKEKFGGLRYYVSGIDYPSPAYDLIVEAERASYTICEECGAPPSKQTPGGWIRTLCAGCRA